MVVISIYILFLWFINQHSHHWGGTTLYELSFLLRNSGRSRFPGGALASSGYKKLCGDYQLSEAFSHWLILRAPKFAKSAGSSFGSWFPVDFALPIKLKFKHVQTIKCHQTMWPKWCRLYNSITVFKPVFYNFMIFYNDVMMYNCITYSGRFWTLPVWSKYGINMVYYRLILLLSIPYLYHMLL